MSKIFGEFVEQFPKDVNSLELTLLNRSLPIDQWWINSTLSSHFLADYISSYLSTEDPDRLAEIKNTISYVGNELLENAVKFSNDNQIKFGVYFWFATEKINAVIFAKNNVTTQKVEKFQVLIQELLSTDTDELYFQQIEKTATDEESEASGLGLLTIINDYSAKLGWKFEPDPTNPQIIIVTTMAQIVV